MKTKILLLSTLMFLIIGTQAQSQEAAAPKKILVAYFSHSGNTRAVANQICKKVNGEIFEIATVKAYPANYNTVVEQAKQEQKSDYRPELKSKLKNIKQYDVIFIGYPNWWSTYPQAVKVFLSQYDFSRKTIIPFCTHEGSEFGNSLVDLKKMCPESTIMEGLAIRGSAAHNSGDRIEVWLRQLKLLK
ncbi:MAG: flavodoxin [Bacteroidota bacterium]|nr:flavodoxin [Bacteroidota bacterium]